MGDRLRGKPGHEFAVIAAPWGCQDIENARVLLAPTLDELVAVCLIAPNLENVLQLLVRERMQVWPYLVVLTVAFILFQPLCNRIVGMHWCT